MENATPRKMNRIMKEKTRVVSVEFKNIFFTGSDLTGDKKNI